MADDQTTIAVHHTKPVLDVRNLGVRFDSHIGAVRAVRDVSFTLEPGETLGIVGESGSGKSVTSLAIMGLLPMPPAVVESGEVLFDGRDLLTLPQRQMRKIRGGALSMIFQDPMTSLNPLLTVGKQLGEVLAIHEGLRGRKARARCAAALDNVGIPNPEQRLAAYPHELSGGMRQRVMIAMGLLCNPKVLIADEPTTALDVTIQAQILELMQRLQAEHGTAIVLITHDLGVVAGMVDRVQVMYAGRVVEKAPADPLFAQPMHPYTRGLLASIPTLEGSPGKRLFSIDGQPPDLADLPPGCSFAPRCTLANERCRESEPPLELAGEGQGVHRRYSACFELDRLLLDSRASLPAPTNSAEEVQR
ncbi:ABC transporter ATP-binding protein [Engelhardtia mirabilis]|uniref:Oligopeptide transport ATP-binding protein OppD n=1 Tax=Engelhardtia mirabilis TaxID=2528011 RepID=A0A518BI46_9BACT|nr:Oligopeptide transport ATP-binding protein OppD [Planctomycetes bacterium Pla133]QDV00977.1 Oligopeptide transport ATP-binding protein OppD [Planctomycetes bacterium Pla86]